MAEGLRPYQPPCRIEPKKAISCKLSSFLSEIKDDHDSDQLQDDLKAPEEWSKDWLVRFNAEKCKVVHLGKPHDQYKHIMMKDDHPAELETTTMEKDLGVPIFDLPWTLRATGQ